MKVTLSILIIFQLAVLSLSKTTDYIKLLDNKISFLNKKLTQLRTNFLADTKNQNQNDDLSFIEKSSNKTNVEESIIKQTNKEIKENNQFVKASLNKEKYSIDYFQNKLDYLENNLDLLMKSLDDKSSSIDNINSKVINTDELTTKMLNTPSLKIDNQEFNIKNIILNDNITNTKELHDLIAFTNKIKSFCKDDLSDCKTLSKDKFEREQEINKKLEGHIESLENNL